MKRYKSIQYEVLNDFKINSEDYESYIKNSLQSTYNTFQYIGFKLGLDDNEIKDFVDDLFTRYELNIYDV